MPNETDPALWIAEEWGRQITRAVESMTGEPVTMSFAPYQITAAELEPAQQDLLWWEQPLSLGADARIWIAASNDIWGEIGNRVLQSAGVDDATPADIRSTYLEIVNQSLSGTATALSTKARKEISCGDGRPAPPTDTGAGHGYRYEITVRASVFPLFAVFTDSVANVSDRAPVQAPLQSGPEDTAPTVVAASKPGSIDLLLDVELPVSVSFGRAQLMLKDVIKLTTGSIVELNRALSEPVEVIVNNCVIARGEVVVVEGNYGIRIKQVISRQERLRTLY